MNLIFIGMRGSGKSSFAGIFSARLGLPWIDLDVELEKEFNDIREGQKITIPTIEKI